MDNDNLKKQRKCLFQPKKRKKQPNFVPAFHFETILDICFTVAYAAVLHLLPKANMEEDRDIKNKKIKNCLGHVKFSDEANSCVTFMFDSLLAN